MTSTVPRPTGLRRPDGRAKLTGAARYAADTPAASVLHAALVPATVAYGQVTRIDAEEASAAPGVVTVLTHRSMPHLHATSSPPLGQPVLPMQDDRVYHEGQPVAMVLAETLEQARHAATLVGIDYAGTGSTTVFGAGEPAIPTGGHVMHEPDESVGDIDAELARAAVIIEQAYTTADRHHNPMEPAATLAMWDGDQLTVHDATQGIGFVQLALAVAFDLPTDHVRVVCPFIGGGFGCKGYVWPHKVLAAAAARIVGRPVKLVLTRAESYTAHGHQPATRQTVTLGANAEGHLTAVRHYGVNACASFADYPEYTTGATRWLYASPAISVRTRIERLDRPQPTAMRAPHEGPGMFALESAMDELAYALDLDPLELRLRNEPERDPMTGQPFSSRPLRECLTRAAERFGWQHRPRAPRSMRDGDQWVGYGMAVATMDTFRVPCSARVRMHADGRVTAECGTQEIGTGLPGVITLVAAEVLGVDPGAVEVHLGDTELPQAGMTAGSSATMGVGSAVHVAATELRGKLDALDGAGGYPARLAAAGLSSLEAEQRWSPDDDAGSRYSIHTYGAVFVEVRVDAELGLVRMPRCVGVYGAGRIINLLAAHSQMIGGITWGYGQAVLEASAFDSHLGRFVSKNLAGYLVPVNADIGEIDVSFVDDHDPHACPIGAKGIGELGAVGVSAAITNAVFHATGVRVRDLPIPIKGLL
ncbi:MAG: xanthine dehydrogenase family protein molybdopterin-binding subunit [Pseudonocardiaceae bacterium]